ncbi:ubiquitin-conjugating enzyme E2 U isoform X3 [Sciurus carolinensis]|uniref:ubiquitin-conjugating enzyme E2 U isoform X3 n=1 Tax=Sciurus carolinensis TaxID=30640 RepID=UPI001FB1E986|nr:ubiquitin-conjugating enzyme E2 U isoform X3 [Sciurus carolinensis]
MIHNLIQVAQSKPEEWGSQSTCEQWQILCCLIMYRRAYVLLERDLKELNQNNYVGITAFPVSDDMLKWQAEIEGLQNSNWHGLVFQLTIDFTLEYNLAPPVVKFITIPFHPNVDPYTAQPCIDFLNDPKKWNTSYTLSSILLALQVMLSYPVLENPVNLQAAQMLIKDESRYRKIVRRLFLVPLQLEDDSLQLPQDQDKLVRSVKSISFNDYYKTWSTIATSKATEYYRIPLLEDPQFIGQYYKWKKTDLQHPKEWKLKYAATKSQLARENRMLHQVSDPIEKKRLWPTPAQIRLNIQGPILVFSFKVALTLSNKINSAKQLHKN